MWPRAVFPPICVHALSRSISSAPTTFACSVHINGKERSIRCSSLGSSILVLRLCSLPKHEVRSFVFIERNLCIAFARRLLRVETGIFPVLLCIYIRILLCNALCFFYSRRPVFFSSVLSIFVIQQLFMNSNGTARTHFKRIGQCKRRLIPYASDRFTLWTSVSVYASVYVPPPPPSPHKSRSQHKCHKLDPLSTPECCNVTRTEKEYVFRALILMEVFFYWNGVLFLS